MTVKIYDRDFAYPMADVQAAQAMHMGPEHGPRAAPVSKKAKVSKAVDKREKTK